MQVKETRCECKQVSEVVGLNRTRLTLTDRQLRGPSGPERRHSVCSPKQPLGFCSLFFNANWKTNNKHARRRHDVIAPGRWTEQWRRCRAGQSSITGAVRKTSIVCWFVLCLRKKAPLKTAGKALSRLQLTDVINQTQHWPNLMLLKWKCLFFFAAREHFFFLSTSEHTVRL